MEAAKKRKPLKESVDYPDFVAKFVKDRIAALDAKVTSELESYIAQDVEGYLLDVHKSPKDLTKIELTHINDFIRERVESGLGGLA
jgi:hypothetical protein